MIQINTHSYNIRTNTSIRYIDTRFVNKNNLVRTSRPYLVVNFDHDYEECTIWAWIFLKYLITSEPEKNLYHFYEKKACRCICSFIPDDKACLIRWTQWYGIYTECIAWLCNIPMVDLSVLGIQDIVVLYGINSYKDTLIKDTIPIKSLEVIG